MGTTGPSGVLEALQLLGRDERVICPYDPFAVGPLRPLRRRHEWVRRVLVFQPRWPGELARFWREATSPAVRPMVWFSSRDAEEYCGLHELVWRREDTRAIRLVDLARLELAPRGQLSVREWGRSFGSMSGQHIVDSRLFEQAFALAAHEAAHLRERWRRLRAENAYLRIVDEDGVRSASLMFYDELILGQLTDEWQTIDQLSARSANAISNGSELRQGTSWFLFSRIRALIALGRIASDRDGGRVRRLTRRR
jgi:hypothetical protein